MYVPMSINSIVSVRLMLPMRLPSQNSQSGLTVGCLWLLIYAKGLPCLDPALRVSPAIAAHAFYFSPSSCITVPA